MTSIILLLLSLPTLWELMSLILFALGVFCYAIKELQSHGKLRWMKVAHDLDFWGKGSYLRKYKNRDSDEGPAFLLSTTALVWLTDGYHLMQFIFIKLFVLSIILYQPLYSWYWDAGIYLGTWYLVFNIVYKVFSK